MKKLLLLLFTILSTIVHAQTMDVITSLNSPSSIAFRGDAMYISEEDRVIKIDLTDPNLTPVDVLTGFIGGSHLLIDGDDLYVALYTGGKVVKLDLSEDNPTAVDVVTEVYGSNGLALKGDFLYIAESTEDKISKVDLTQENPVAVDVVTGLEFPNALCLNGDDLYFIEVGEDKISKIDLSESQPTPVDVITDLETPSLGLILLGNELYFSQYEGDKVSKININDAIPTVTNVVTGIDGPTQLLQRDDELFIAVRLENKISKIEDFNNSVLSTTELDQASISLYPNPTMDFIKIEGFTEIQSGTLYNGEGTKVMDFTLQDDLTLDVQDLESGIYFLVLKNGWNQKIVKK